MNSANEFFIIFIATILITRLFIFLKPIAGPTVGNFRIHHYVYGLLLVVMGLIIKSLLAYAIGAGLFVDELMFILIKGKTHADNYSLKSIVGTVVFILLVFILRTYFVSLL